MAITIKCKKCNNENPLGDIFCRQCGEELDMAQLDQGKIKLGRRRRGGCAKTGLEIALIVIILFGFITVVCSFIAPSGVEFPVGQDDAYEKRISEAVKEVETALNPPPDSNRRVVRDFVVKQQNAGGVFKSFIMKDQEAKNEKVAITVLDGIVRFSWRKLYYGFPVTLTVYGKLEEAEESEEENHFQIAANTRFVVIGTALGKVPTGITSMLHIRKYFFTFLESQEFKDLSVKYSAIEINEEGDFKLTKATGKPPARQ